MRSLENSLCCLAHPVSFLSIGLLILNDHVLKILVPSWLTGKLSDFAGLFFFPFLLAIILGIAFRRASPKTIGALAIGVTAIWFALVKTTTWGNALTADFVSRVLGVPVQIVLDPTDLIALVVLLPAWRLWNRAKVERPTRLGWVALGVASLATVATSCPPPLPEVTYLASYDGTVYWTDYEYSSYLAKSTDSGRTWIKEQGILPVEAKPKKRSLSDIVCDSPNTHVCYRSIQFGNKVEQSNDGGKTWRVIWDGGGRREYLERRRSSLYGMFAVCARGSNIGPFDLTLTKPIDEKGLHTLVVAVGTEGVLVREPNGTWRQYAVPDVVPLKFAAESLYEVTSVITVETFICFFGAVIVFLLFLPSPGKGKATNWYLVPPLAFFPLGWLPLYLWAIGTIPYYGVAIFLSIIIVGFLVFLSADRINRVNSSAIETKNT